MSLILVAYKTSPLFTTRPLNFYGSLFPIAVGRPIGEKNFTFTIEPLREGQPSVRLSVRAAFLLGNFASGDSAAARKR